MDDSINYMDLREFRDLGFLQEANRGFFHPHGLALELEIDHRPYGDRVRLSGVWDYRHDHEGIAFGDTSSAEFRDKAAYVAAELERHYHARELLYGSVIQPLGWSP